MKKIMSLIVIGMMCIGIVGCGNKSELEKAKNIFKSENFQNVNTTSISEYCETINIKGTNVYHTNSIGELGATDGLNVYNLSGLDLIVFEVVIDNEIYDQFQKDVKEIGVKKAREKYGISELIENMIETNIEQQKIISSIDEEITLQCRIVTDEDYKPYESLVISVYNNDIGKDVFK